MQAVMRKVGGRTALVACAVVACALGLSILGAPLRADEDDAAKAKPKTYPYIDGELSIEIHHDSVFDTNNPALEGSDSFTKTELDATAHFSRYFALQTHFTFEPVLDRDPGEDRFFSDNGVYAEEFYGKVTLDPFEIFAGKFNPAFGRAWEDAPGVYGTDMVEDSYQLTERLGLGFSVSREHTGIGKLKLTASAFYADTSVLSNSGITNRGQLDHIDGGLSNTNSLDSFALSLEGEGIPGLPGISYNLGFVHQAGGVNDIDDQNGVVFGLQSKREYNGVKIALIGEAAYLDYGGDFYETDDPTQFVDSFWLLTLGAEAAMGRYHAAVAYTSRYAELFNATDFDDYQFQISAGIDLERGWKLDLGYKYLTEATDESHIVGLLLKKTIEFDTSELEPAGPALK
jgi:hypothetical protein